MPLELVNLDDHTRRCMLAELDRDVGKGGLYLSPQLSDRGRSDYEGLLRAALRCGTDASLADDLARDARVIPIRRWQKPGEEPPTECLESATSATLAEREFHRFYARGLCRRAIAEGVVTLVIYRAGPPAAGRANSDAMVGVRIDAASLLEDLRGVPGSTPPRGLPACSDARLTVRLP